MSTETNEEFADGLNEMDACAGIDNDEDSLDNGLPWLIDSSGEPFMIVSPRFQIMMQPNGHREIHIDPDGIIAIGLDTSDDTPVRAIYNESGPSGLPTWKPAEELPIAQAPQPIPDKRYLGDGLYADFDGHMLILTAENGICATNTVYLEPQVWDMLKQYVKDLDGRM